ncbi:hypothetical protein GKE82_00925 [Conexibacter sp. W3-3-2]|uniref:Uncharacterized protein n=1 Tax=Paraconexibacter algicola TaxID=2133960 RepID=A0A2T4UEH1_9ACTN|nr:MULTISPECIES: hypothetical protein [Solirubrobacterales]MTD42903.1 hypothetical protein [Conexibacter sp. W3-3-2]PTL56184.1 hypothetical protein C7Y72_14430 [Paraconexibacter algicola]
MPEPRDVHHAATSVMSAVMVVLGVAMLVSTLARGGGPLALGTILGVMFVAVGAGRIFIARSGSQDR